MARWIHPFSGMNDEDREHASEMAYEIFACLLRTFDFDTQSALFVSAQWIALAGIEFREAIGC